MIFRITYIIVAVTLLILAACTKFRHLPPEPKIEFRSFVMFDSIDILGNPSRAGKLEFYFEDGDGDVGIKVNEFSEEDTTNLFITGYRKIDGSFIEMTDSTDVLKPSDYRIPFIERSGQNHVIMGTVEVTFLYLFFTNNDTIMYEFYIKDRAGNLSNKEISCEIAFSGEGGCVTDSD
ncbi:MAG TPA: hypothetical protein VMW76_01225 [Bacteroidales bacterium]|nr:hypothetical protein [Bacteroidales bacterium]